MTFINDYLKTILAEIAKIAKEKFGGYLQAASLDAMDFILTARDDINNWYDLYKAGSLTGQEFIWLIKGKKDLALLTTLEKMGLSAVQLEEFRDGLIYTIIKVALGALVKKVV